MYIFAEMKTASRTRRTVQNSRTSFLLFLFQIFVGFYSRKVFLDYLGAEVLGVNTTLSNILSFLNLTELGIGIAMSTSLYKPIVAQDQDGICEILTVQGILYKRIAIILCGLSIPILIAMPWIFPTVECGISYVYVTYLVFLSSSITSYLWNYKQVLISADQKNYILLPWIHGVRYIKIFLQLFFLLVVNLGFWGWIVLEFLAIIITVFVINWLIMKEYPWLKNVSFPTRVLLRKYHDLIIKTKQIFIHKIGLFVLEQTSPLIIYALVSLTMVTYYGNYMVIIGYMTTLMNVIFEGMGASIGSLVAENNKKHTLEVFWELFSSRLWISGCACFGIYLFMSPFISIWIGDKYLLGETTLLILVLTMFIRLIRTVTDSFNHAYQLFGDVWSPVVEGVINLGCSFMLGSVMGLNGILFGILLSVLVTGLFWKPYYLFSRGLKTPTRFYYYQWVLHVTILLGTAYGTLKLLNNLFVDNGIIGVIIRQSVIFCCFVMISYILLFLTTKSMRRFTDRILTIIHVK